MKHFLRTLNLLALVGFSTFVFAQPGQNNSTGSCSVNGLVVQNVQLVDPTNCTYSFDVAFTIKKSKYIFFQSYVEENILTPVSPNPWPDNFDCLDGRTTINGAVDAPTAATIGDPVLNIAIHDEDPNNPAVDPILLDTYIPDPDVDIEGKVAGTFITKFELPDDSMRIVITGLQVDLDETICGQPFVLITDFFASNANAGNGNAKLPIQCVSCGHRSAVGFYDVAGTITCPPNAQYTIRLTNNTALELTGNYLVYADVNGNGLLTTEVDVLISPVGATFELEGVVDATTLISGDIPDEYGGMDLILMTNLTEGFATGVSTLTTITAPNCAALPVRFKSFEAARRNADVQLTWETATEDHNRGFYVQRNTGGGWKDLGFVATKGDNGNSTTDLLYNYTDANNTTRAVSQYRIMQVDIDGKTRLSDVRQVRGYEQMGKVTIYPNPSSDGKVNVVFGESKSAWNVFVTDMNGRAVKQYKGVFNNVVVDNLVPGMYMVRLVDLQSGTQLNEKVIINNR